MVTHSEGGITEMDHMATLSSCFQKPIQMHNTRPTISTAASLHCAALRANVSCLELAFDPDGMRSKYGEIIQDGQMALGQAPGWGVSPEL
jgi:L-alanine-DL-glutamate epimerase-like enolase superfamily enzyme